MPISSLSRQYVDIPIIGATGAEAVEVAFTQPGVEPTEQDWRPASWANITTVSAEARILIGPGTGVVLSDGTYQAWVRVTTPLERPVLPSGLVPIT